MGRSQIDREKLRVFVRRLPEEYLLQVLDRAIDLLPKTRLGQLIEGFVDLRQLRSERASPETLIDAVTAFHDASLRREYYQDFDVDSKNFTQKSRGTTTWIAECHRLLDRCVVAAGDDDFAAACKAFETIFALLRRIDDGDDTIVFFADEHGSWQVGVDWRRVLPAWFTCLRQTAEPAEYARAAIAMIEDFVAYDREWFLEKAQGTAGPPQRAELNRLTGATRASAPGS